MANPRACSPKEVPRRFNGLDDEMSDMKTMPPSSEARVTILSQFNKALFREVSPLNLSVATIRLWLRSTTSFGS